MSTTIEFQIAAEERDDLQQYRDFQTDFRLRQRFIALIMLAEGIPAEQVISILGISLSSLKNWIKQYQSKGIEALNSFQYKAKTSYLNPVQLKELREWIIDEKPGNRETIRHYIQQEFQVSYSLSAISKQLKKMGIKKNQAENYSWESPYS